MTTPPDALSAGERIAHLVADGDVTAEEAWGTPDDEQPETVEAAQTRKVFRGWFARFIGK